MIASKFVKCIAKLLNLNPYHLLPIFKYSNNPKFISAKEAEKLNIEKLCENLDLENTFKIRNCNGPSCKSDVSMSKQSNCKYPPACHSVPCCNFKFELKCNFSKQISECRTKVSAASITDPKSTRSQATCTAPLMECKSAIYILDQRRGNCPKKPFSAPCGTFNHDEAIRELCDKAMKTCAEARKIINFYKHNGPSEEDCQIERNPDIELSDKNQNLISDIKLEITPCPYCTQPSSIPHDYSCPFCAKNVKNCACIHCPHCKKSRITAPSKKSNQSKTKFFKFDKPLIYPLTVKTNPPDAALPEKNKSIDEKHNPCDLTIESDCKLSVEQKTEKRSASKSAEKKKRPKSSINKNRKTRSLSPAELQSKPIKRKLKQSHEPLLKMSDKILKKKDFAKNIPNEEKILQIPWMPPNEATANEAKICARLRSQLNPRMRNSTGDRILNEHFQKVCKSSERKVKTCVKQENVEKKQKNSSTSETVKQSKVGKTAIKLQKRRSNSSDSPIKLIHLAKADRPLPLNKNGISVRNYCEKKEDGSQPKDFLCDCPKAVREIGRCEKMEYDEYFGDCYKCREYFKYDKYSYFTMEECMKNYRLKQPDPRKKKDDCE